MPGQAVSNQGNHEKGRDEKDRAYPDNDWMHWKSVWKQNQADGSQEKDSDDSW